MRAGDVAVMKSEVPAAFFHTLSLTVIVKVPTTGSKDGVLKLNHHLN